MEDILARIISVLFVIAIIGGLMGLGATIGVAIIEKQYQVEAVKKGYAEWKTDSNGQTTWNWKENKK